MSLAAPVTNGKFSFSVDSFYVETSGHNLHRRATVPELQILFQPAAAGAAAPPDPVGHWYEAQLLHYGIAPSKNKAVAKMRLLDAVRGGGLAVPKDIAKIETDLKKEWKKKDKEAKSGKSEVTETKTATTAKSGGKRKRDGEETDTAQPAPKTTAKKTAETNKKPASTAKAEAKPKPEPKKTTAVAKKKDETKDPEPAPRSHTAKRGGARGGSTASSRSNAPKPEPEQQRPRLKQTARRSGGPPLSSRERKATPPPPYSEFPSDTAQQQQAYGGDPMDIDDPSDDGSSDGGDDGSSTPLPPLGLVNGEYEISSSDLNDWSQFPEDEFNLILGLAGNSMWGAYDFGMFHGIMQLQERPWSSSYKKIPFKWRGRDRGEGEMSFGPSCTGWIQFLGDGEIKGQLQRCYGEGRFQGQRISGEETQPPRDVRSMREEWNGYTAKAYEDENRRRWG